MELIATFSVLEMALTSLIKPFKVLLLSYNNAHNMAEYQRKAIPNFPGYEIDTNGVVYSLPKKNRKKEIILKQNRGRKGYLYLALHKNGKHKFCLVHRLIADIFIANPKCKPCVCHKDGNKLNNNIENLYHGTPSENQLDAVRHGTAGGFKSKGENHGKCKLHQYQVMEILGNTSLMGKELAKAYGISKAQISRIRSGKRWKHITI